MKKLLASFYLSVILTPLLLIGSCSGVSKAPRLAPVRAVAIYPKSWLRFHIVEPGETLYAIAWQYNMDYRNLATLNKIDSPYQLSIGQRLTLEKTSSRYLKKTVDAKKIIGTKNNLAHHPVHHKYKKILGTKQPWIIPLQGKIISHYDLKQGHKGIYFLGKASDSVRAISSGQVAYAGNGLKGYGNLIIIKHDNEFLSAYAHNKRLLVKEGQRIHQGQLIAVLGLLKRNQYGLYFEMRRFGKPVDPLSYFSKNA